MPTERPPAILVLHGARGDLSRRFVLPALAALAEADLLPPDWALLGTGRSDMPDEDFVEIVRDTLADHPAREAVVRRARFTADVTRDEPGAMPELLDDLAEELGGAPHVVHYLAVPPSAFARTTRALAAHGLHRGPGTVRVVYEKPYGTSPDSFAQLDAAVHEVLDEDQVFRIDHFLGKEATQNLHVLRLANELFATVWDREHVEQVQIDVPETLDVADRAEFYDATGAALDMLVTHLFQVLAEVAMEPPDVLDAQHLAAAREEVLAALRPIDPAEVVLGQFDGYRDLDAVADESDTDTYVAARVWVDDDRWRGVPFLLRTGKRMAADAQQVTLVLRRGRDTLLGGEVAPGRLTVSLAGDGAIQLTTTVKRPGPVPALALGTARLDLDDVSGGDPLPPYASLLDDVLRGDRSLFPTPVALEQAWRAFAPVLGDDRPAPIVYHPDTWGPEEADRLAAPSGWALP
ncbi:glucose-6-phosphate dehydrogenase [Isoptericola sp. b441]|uniref:Glucose-6-phosphate 1-dehydrogenase n=1 Tax=Actinotalea lenta TaxID=3064654 RepID=A0ABT9DBF3_9CELL|nr:MULTISPECIES: glucose-6-phosphate dehydrogenase [unclassified Isoptericola]MDO8107856.1 glucose-6-phosphate dehydrogenase [Isoptericola sp. b441]MDO8120474.1 glucose-6-phosphate dehydrogenase [Isoptericola sp. b490]